MDLINTLVAERHVHASEMCFIQIRVFFCHYLHQVCLHSLAFPPKPTAKYVHFALFC